MTITNCDFCGKKLNVRTRDSFSGKFNLTKDSTCYLFSGEITVSAKFTTTGLDWCEECLKQALINMIIDPV